MPNFFLNLEGTLSNLFQFGLNRAQIRSTAGGELEIRDASDTGFAVIRGAAPVGDNDLVTKFYADTLEKPLIVKRQANTSASIPNNTAVRGFVVVTTAGSGAVIGDLLYDDGSNAGVMQILTAVEGRVVAITETLSGGSISFEEDSIYIWDLQGTEWIKIGDVGETSGALRVVRYTINNTATQDSTFSIPQNSRILKARLQITTAYSGGATISIGNTATADLFMTTSQNNPQAINKVYVVDQDTSVGGSDSVVRTTIGGAPAAGAGVVSVWFTMPNN